MYYETPRGVAKASTIASKLPWHSFVAPGVVMQKSGALQKTFAFRGQDLDSKSAASLAALATQVNDCVRRLGNGWSFHFEAQCFESKSYPGSIFDNRAAYLFDEERRRHYTEEGFTHFERSYYLTIAFLLPSEIQSKFGTMIQTSGGVSNPYEDFKQEVEEFSRTATNTVLILNSAMEISPLSDEETLAYLHTAVNTVWHPIRMPPEYDYNQIDKILSDVELTVASTLKINNMFTPFIGINDFPADSYPGILDILNSADIPHRWTSRWICFDKLFAKKKLKEAADIAYGNRKGLGQFVSETLTKSDSGRVDHSALSDENEANAAIVALSRDTIGFGHYSSTVQVWDPDLDRALKKADYMLELIQRNGFTAFVETTHASEAFVHMLPGDQRAYVRRHNINTSNYSHIIPITSVWAGHERNPFLEKVTGHGAPQITCRTDRGTPFFYSPNSGDTGHTIVFGPTGQGKSVFLKALAIQGKKYPGSRTVYLDFGNTARQLTMAVGGIHYDPGQVGTVKFQPLRNLETTANITWACEFIELILDQQRVPVDLRMRGEIQKALQDMVDEPLENRTITTFRAYCQYTDEKGQPIVRDALKNYAQGGMYGDLFDANDTNIEFADWLCFETQSLLELSPAAYVPAFEYLFHVLEDLFDGQNWAQLIIDEAWKILSYPRMEAKIREWLKTLRKRLVFCILATQEIADAANSAISSTLIEQCPCKVYLPNPEASTAASREYYHKFGLTDSEITLISTAKPKKEYLYKSARGCRLFSLDLGPAQLALINGDLKNLPFLDSLMRDFDPSEWLERILANERVDELPVVQACLNRRGTLSTKKEDEKWNV